MIPSFFIKLDKLPLTPNGKLDRNYLSKIELKLTSKIKLKPSTKTEEKMIEIFQKVLNIDNIGINDNFLN
jgi:surfactin family lipopeptide synthetase A